MLAGLLPHDGSAGGGGSARHGCCKRAKIMKDRREEIQFLILFYINIKQNQSQNSVTREYSRTVTENTEHFKPVSSHCVMEQTLQKASFHTSWNRDFLKLLKLQHTRCTKEAGEGGKRLYNTNVVWKFKQLLCGLFLFCFLTTWQPQMHWIWLPETTWYYCHVHMASIKCRDVINNQECGYFLIIIAIFKTVAHNNWHQWQVKQSYLNFKLYSIHRLVKLCQSVNYLNWPSYSQPLYANANVNCTNTLPRDVNCLIKCSSNLHPLSQCSFTVITLNDSR